MFALSLGIVALLSAPAAAPAPDDTSGPLLHGTVSAVDAARGSITIQTDPTPAQGHIDITGRGVDVHAPGTYAQPARVLTLQARPADIAALKPGQELDFQSETWDGVAWLVPTEPQAAQSAFAGVVDDVDLASGTLVVGGQIVHAHPRQLVGVAPGESVLVQYALVGPLAWVSSIAPTP